jgi:oxygen-independent coproporphyrinogen-3 oxidase
LNKAGLYIHFPFCRRACFYCHFFKKKLRPDLAGGYLRHLEKEMTLRRDPGLAVDSVYIGGGSPSLLNAGQVAGLLEHAAKSFRIEEKSEITLEANPEDLDLPLLKGFRAAGVNRLSIGAQSFQDLDLRFLRRTHDAGRALQAFDLAAAAGFSNISIDLIIGLPTQTTRTLGANLRIVETMRPSHVSVYILEGVPRPETDDHDARLYFQARRALLDLGFRHYEVSNFCRPGKASRHNLKYWRMAPYVGLGPSAAGCLAGGDYRNVSNLDRYAAAVTQGKLPLLKTRPLDPCKRRIVTGLRLLAGIPAPAFRAFSAETAFLLQEGLLVRREKNLAVPPEKILLLNEILGYFV